MTNKIELCEYWEKGKIVQDPRILSAFRAVLRENFIGGNTPAHAYGDYPLPIGHDQTISQPTTVVSMLELLEVQAQHNVLEIGAGSGYNAALLGQLARKVHSVEKIRDLAAEAEKNLRLSGVNNVTVIQGNGQQGHAAEAPYQRIIVTAAARRVPPALLAQLSINGILVIPVGPPHHCEMHRILKTSDKHHQTTTHGLFSFVPLV